MPRTMPPPTDHTFATLLETARPRVLALLRRLCPAHAEDLLQETWTKVWRLRGGFDANRAPDGCGEAWLLQAAFRVFCDHRRRSARRASEHGGEALADAAAAATACPVELRDEVQHHLRALPPLERDLLLGFHAHGWSLKELAARHALPLNTVKSHLHRARQRLQNGGAR